jgi:hypothetical protein
MKSYNSKFCAVLLSLTAAVALACHGVSITATATPATITPGTSSTITATVTRNGTPVANQTVKFEITSGFATCGNFGGRAEVEVTTNASGVASVSFTGSNQVLEAACTSTIKVSIFGHHATTVTVTVRPP